MAENDQHRESKTVEIPAAVTDGENVTNIEEVKQEYDSNLEESELEGRSKEASEKMYRDLKAGEDIEDVIQTPEKVEDDELVLEASEKAVARNEESPNTEVVDEETRKSETGVSEVQDVGKAEVSEVPEKGEAPFEKTEKEAADEPKEKRETEISESQKKDINEGSLETKENLHEFPEKAKVNVESSKTSEIVDNSKDVAPVEASCREDTEDFFEQTNLRILENQLPVSLTSPRRVDMGFDFNKLENVVFLSNQQFAYSIGRVVCIQNYVFEKTATTKRKEPNIVELSSTPNHTNTTNSTSIHGGSILHLDDICSSSSFCRYIHCREDGGVGGLAVDATGEYLAVAEKSTFQSPCVYIYSRTSKNNFSLSKVLRNGTSGSYSNIAFNPHETDSLATVGNSPDYLLIIWNWKTEMEVLRCKAFSQEVYRVSWSPTLPGQLITSGLGHIKFWKIAKTFTGLKLQGHIGKFGKAELSDIKAFQELPDGKVVTGTDMGKLLLWEGIFVKAELTCGTTGEGCHAGAVTCLFLDPSSSCPSLSSTSEAKEEGVDARLVSAGADGRLRWWSVNEMFKVARDDDSSDVRLTLLREITLQGGHFQYSLHGAPRAPEKSESKKDMKQDYAETKPKTFCDFSLHHLCLAMSLCMGFTSGACITHVSFSPDKQSWLLQDSGNGIIWSFDPSSGCAKGVLNRHASKVLGAQPVPSNPGLLITAGAEGSIKAWNYTQCGPELFSHRWSTAISSVAWSPSSFGDRRKRDIFLPIPPKGVVAPLFALGFQDGVIRVMRTEGLAFRLVYAAKPHSCPVKQLVFSPDDGFLVSLGVDDSIFYFENRRVHGESTHSENLESTTPSSPVYPIYHPTGVINAPHPVTFIQWDDNSETLLACMDNGMMVEYFKPNVDSLDTSESYSIYLNYKGAVLNIPSEESTVAQPTNASPLKGFVKANEKREESENADIESTTSSSPSCPVSSAVYLSEHKILLCGSNALQGALWSVNLNDIPITVRATLGARRSEILTRSCRTASFCVDDGSLRLRSESISRKSSVLSHRSFVPCPMTTSLVNAVPLVHLNEMKKMRSSITFLQITNAKTWLLAGTADGRILIFNLENLPFFYQLQCMDIHYGIVRDVALSDDSAWLFCCGGDGSIGSFTFNPDGFNVAVEWLQNCNSSELAYSEAAT